MTGLNTDLTLTRRVPNNSSYHARLLSEGDELAGATLHRVIICALRGTKVGHERNQLLHMPIRVVPNLDAERKVVVP